MARLCSTFKFRILVASFAATTVTASSTSAAIVLNQCAGLFREFDSSRYFNLEDVPIHPSARAGSSRAGGEQWKTEEFTLARSKSLAARGDQAAQVKDVYRVTAQVQRSVLGKVFLKDEIRVDVFRKSQHRDSVGDQILVTIRLGRSETSIWDPTGSSTGFNVDDLYLPTSLSGDSIVRKILFPHPRDLHGEFVLFIETKNGAIHRYAISNEALEAMADDPISFEGPRQSGEAFALEAVMTGAEFGQEMARLQFRH